MMNHRAFLRALRLWSAVVLVVLLAGCSFGHLAGRAQLDLYDLPTTQAGDLPPLAPNGIPYAALARSCRAAVDGDSPLLALRPGVGAQLNLATWSSGIMSDLVPGRGNPGPPAIDAMPVALRLVAQGDRLDANEQRVLATFLITNRLTWYTPGGASTVNERFEVATAVREHQAALWNALVRSLCVEVRNNEPLPDHTPVSGTGRTMEVFADMASLCRALPAGRQVAFASSFLDAPSAACGDKPNFMGIGGLIDKPARSDWAAGALDVGIHGNGANRYFANGAQASIMVLNGAITLDSVRPSSPSAPDWSLAAWEASGICSTPEHVYTRIVSLRLAGGRRTIDVVDVGGPHLPTHRIVLDGVRARIEKIGGSWLYPAIARADLARLTRSDVEQLNWTVAGGAYQPVEPAGCVRIR